MGHQLWISPNTGIRRKGTTFRELQTLFNDEITTRFIYEPIFSCSKSDLAQDIKQHLEQKDFDIAGVIDDNFNVVGYIKKDELNGDIVEEHFKPIELSRLISESTPISKLSTILFTEPYAFILENNNIKGIVTRSDINKPIARVYIFGIISLFELHLNFWIEDYYGNESWNAHLNEERITAAEKIFKLRDPNRMGLSLLECIQLSDKKVILKKTDEFLNIFDFNKIQFHEFLENTQKLRDQLAHSQNSIIAILGWEKFANTIDLIESFLSKSENFVEEKINLTLKQSNEEA